LKPQYVKKSKLELKSRRRSRRLFLSFAILAVIVAVVAVVAIPLLPRSPVIIVLEGNEMEVPFGITVGEVAAEHLDPSIMYGDLLAVDDSLLEAHAGDSPTFMVQTADADQSYAMDADTSIRSALTITVVRGDDIVEDIAEEEVDIIEPTLVARSGSGPLGHADAGQPGVSIRQYGEISGIEVDLFVRDEMRPMGVHFSPYKGNDPKLIALTYDDGPDPTHTPALLEVLEEVGIKATFFVTGAQVARHPEIAREIVDAGHQIANHSHSHDDYRSLNDGALRDDINRAQDLIEDASGVRPKWIRPPYGAVNNDVFERFAAEELNVALWNIDPRDWLRPGADYIAEHVIEHARSGAVVVLHDGGGDRSQTVEATRAIVETLTEDGFEFVTVERMHRRILD